MSTLQEYISAIGCFQGLLLFALLIADARTTTASRILGCICLIIASIFLTPFLLLNAEIKMVAWMTAWIVYLPAGLGALSYLYFRSALVGHPLRAGDLFHALPWLFCCVLLADMLFADSRQIIDWVSGTAPWWSWRLQAGEFVMFAQAFGYAGLAALMIWRYRRRANNNLANFNPSVFKWALLFQVFSIAIWLLKAVPSLTSVPGPLIFWESANLLLVIFIYLIALMQWRNPQLFLVERSGEEPVLSVSVTSERTEDVRDGELDPATRKELFKTLTAQVQDRKLYLDSEITLTRLAEKVRLSKHHVSEVLNRHAGKNFYEFINGYRVDFACERLGTDPTQKILDIALEAGFSSKTTFNVTFKQLTGQTPTQYRRTVEQKTG